LQAGRQSRTRNGAARDAAMHKSRWQGERLSALIRRFDSAPGMTIITDPLFYLLAIPAIFALGLGKGGFAGLGMISTPLLALRMPPLQAAAILLPIILCRDVEPARTLACTPHADRALLQARLPSGLFDLAGPVLAGGACHSQSLTGG